MESMDGQPGFLAKRVLGYDSCCLSLPHILGFGGEIVQNPIIYYATSFPGYIPVRSPFFIDLEVYRSFLFW